MPNWSIEYKRNIEIIQVLSSNIDILLKIQKIGLDHKHNNDKKNELEKKLESLNKLDELIRDEEILLQFSEKFYQQEFTEAISILIKNESSCKRLLGENYQQILSILSQKKRGRVKLASILQDEADNSHVVENAIEAALKRFHDKKYQEEKNNYLQLKRELSDISENIRKIRDEENRLNEELRAESYRLSEFTLQEFKYIDQMPISKKLSTMDKTFVDLYKKMMNFELEKCTHNIQLLQNEKNASFVVLLNIVKLNDIQQRLVVLRNLSDLQPRLRTHFQSEIQQIAELEKQCKKLSDRFDLIKNIFDPDYRNSPNISNFIERLRDQITPEFIFDLLDNIKQSRLPLSAKKERAKFVFEKMIPHINSLSNLAKFSHLFQAEEYSFLKSGFLSSDHTEHDMIHLLQERISYVLTHPRQDSDLSIRSQHQLNYIMNYGKTSIWQQMLHPFTKKINVGYEFYNGYVLFSRTELMDKKIDGLSIHAHAYDAQSLFNPKGQQSITFYLKEGEEYRKKLFAEAFNLVLEICKNPNPKVDQIKRIQKIIRYARVTHIGAKASWGSNCAEYPTVLIPPEHKVANNFSKLPDHVKKKLAWGYKIPGSNAEAFQDQYGTTPEGYLTDHILQNLIMLLEEPVNEKARQDAIQYMLKLNKVYHDLPLIALADCLLSNESAENREQPKSEQKDSLTLVRQDELPTSGSSFLTSEQILENARKILDNKSYGERLKKLRKEYNDDYKISTGGTVVETFGDIYERITKVYQELENAVEESKDGPINEWAISEKSTEYLSLCGHLFKLETDEIKQTPRELEKLLKLIQRERNSLQNHCKIKDKNGVRAKQKLKLLNDAEKYLKQKNLEQLQVLQSISEYQDRNNIFSSPTTKILKQICTYIATTMLQERTAGRHMAI